MSKNNADFFKVKNPWSVMKDRQTREPFSAPYQDRLNALRHLHEKGCKTWVSIDPYPTPNWIVQNLGDLLEAVSFVDRIIFGRTNYNKKATAYSDRKNFYNQCAYQVMEFCKAHGISCHIFYLRFKVIFTYRQVFGYIFVRIRDFFTIQRDICGAIRNGKNRWKIEKYALKIRCFRMKSAVDNTIHISIIFTRLNVDIAG